MELVANLPAVGDCWSDPFYRETFAPAEIAYCLVQPEPAPHFCARWCAKEALRKCDPAFAATALNALEVAHETSGAPYLLHHVAGAARRLPHALSLSHTGLAAVAVVVRVEVPDSPTAPADPAPVVAAPAANRGGSAVVAALLALAALGVSVAALYRTFP
jgi:phosphopantetheinyl transferase (holo-ACP synthase)